MCIWVIHLFFCYCFCNFRVLGWKRILKNCILMHQKTVTCNFKNDESNKEKIVNASGVSWHQSWTKKNQFQLTNWLNLQLSTLPAKKLHCIAGLSKLNLNDFSLITSSDHHIFFIFRKGSCMDEEVYRFFILCPKLLLTFLLW